MSFATSRAAKSVGEPGPSERPVPVGGLAGDAQGVGRVTRCEQKTEIKPFGLLVDQVLEQDPYKDATQLS